MIRHRQFTRRSHEDSGTCYRAPWTEECLKTENTVIPIGLLSKDAIALCDLIRFDLLSAPMW